MFPYRPFDLLCEPRLPLQRSGYLTDSSNSWPDDHGNIVTARLRSTSIRTSFDAANEFNQFRSRLSRRSERRESVEGLFKEPFDYGFHFFQRRHRENIASMFNGAALAGAENVLA